MFSATALTIVVFGALLPQAATLQLEPARVRAGMFFGGAEVVVEAEVPAGLKVAVELVGIRQDVELVRRGKKLGLLWMKAGQFKVENAPQFYLLATATEETKLAPHAELERLQFGYTALRRQLRVDGKPLDDASFEQFVKLKQSEGLYAQPAALELTPGSDAARRHLRAVFHLPAKVQPAVHRVRLVAFADGQGRVLAQKDLPIEQVGVAKWITSVAHHHGLLYGIGAVLVALAVGLLTGFLFGRGSGAH